MKLDLNKYSSKANKEFIQNIYRASRDRDMVAVISMVAPSIHCPNIALGFFLAETEGFTPELVTMIERLAFFYKYDEVLNQPLNSPFLDNMKRRDIKE